MNNSVSKIAACAAVLLFTAASTLTLPNSVQAESATPSHAPQIQREPHQHQSREGKFRTGGGHFIITETAKLLEMDRSELVQNLKGGKSLYTIAQEKKGWNEKQYVQKLSEAAGKRLDKAVTEGRITGAEAQKLKAGLPAILKQRIGQVGQFQDRSVDPHRNNI
ncbi:hypothetical protein A8L34_11260 [Bacillus sp. FJAT-27264]|uniref:hypothetical protein n=1 Tax=Paenibacillus sp. (strain DSM 101736 / FJAT-27264) TaxID=1850362 RepID=UPI000807C3DB|nr:hypothetical protein [Bacillus sp. FJAT-27264]OBZ14503.1 hypothetical protein A8L34_11260 [Bacillus sp. FJAT-27264]